MAGKTDCLEMVMVLLLVRSGGDDVERREANLFAGTLASSGRSLLRNAHRSTSEDIDI